MDGHLHEDAPAIPFGPDGRGMVTAAPIGGKLAGRCTQSRTTTAEDLGEDMTTGRGLRLGEAVLGGAVVALGLFIGIETWMLGGAGGNAPVGPGCSPS